MIKKQNKTKLSVSQGPSAGDENDYRLVYKGYPGILEMFNTMTVVVITQINSLNLFNFIITYAEFYSM